MPITTLAIRALAVVAMLLAVTRPAAAQIEPRATLVGGYSFLREQGPGGLGVSNYPIGWAVAGALRLGSSRISAAGEFAVNTRTNGFDETARLIGALGGARVALFGSSRVIVFAQTLVGLERFSEPGFSESGFAIQPGAGLDWVMGSRYFVRLQADYRMSFQSGGTFKDIGVFAGAGVRLGR